MLENKIKIVVKIRHSENATKIWSNFPLDLTLLSKRQIMWEIVSKFVASLENLYFNTLGFFALSFCRIFKEKETSPMEISNKKFKI